MAKGEDRLPDGTAPSEDAHGTAVHGRNGNGIDFVHKGDVIDTMAAAGSGRLQSLEGFLPDYNDIVDYIVRSTHKMWEEGGIGLLYQHYSHNTVVWSDWGVSYGRDRTFEYVYQRESAFPDLRLYADSVVWAGDDVAGFRSNHRITQTGYNMGYSKWGPPTGRRIQYSSFALCIVKNNRIVEEWLAHDEISGVRQLGLTVDDALKELTVQIDRGAIEVLPSEVPRVAGQTTPDAYVRKRPANFDVEDFVHQAMSEIWNWRLFNKISQYYAPECRVHGPNSREMYGHGDLRAYILSILSSFPDGMIQIEDVYWNGSEEEGYRTAVRWTLLGTNRGAGIYGRPTGKPIRVIGISEHRIKHGKILEEWTIFNELALRWKLRYA
ncbi:MAG: ester cyclase [Chloroflexota bacterium]